MLVGKVEHCWATSYCMLYVQASHKYLAYTVNKTLCCICVQDDIVLVRASPVQSTCASLAT